MTYVLNLTSLPIYRENRTHHVFSIVNPLFVKPLFMERIKLDKRDKLTKRREIEIN